MVLARGDRHLKHALVDALNVDRLQGRLFINELHAVQKLLDNDFIHRMLAGDAIALGDMALG